MPASEPGDQNLHRRSGAFRGHHDAGTEGDRHVRAHTQGGDRYRKMADRSENSRKGLEVAAVPGAVRHGFLSENRLQMPYAFRRAFRN